MTPLDYLAIGLYAVVIAVIGYRAARRIGTPDDLFLAGRSFGSGVIGLSLFASNISATTLVGLAGAAYGAGIAVARFLE